MSNWRRVIILSLFFVIVAVIYFVVQGAAGCLPGMTECQDRTLDLTGFLMLILAGVSMGFGLIVLIRGSRDV